MLGWRRGRPCLSREHPAERASGRGRELGPSSQPHIPVVSDPPPLREAQLRDWEQGRPDHLQSDLRELKWEDSVKGVKSQSPSWLPLLTFLFWNGWGSESQITSAGEEVGPEGSPGRLAVPSASQAQPWRLRCCGKAGRGVPAPRRARAVSTRLT